MARSFPHQRANPSPPIRPARDDGGPITPTPRDAAITAALTPAIELMSERLADRPDIVSALEAASHHVSDPDSTAPMKPADVNSLRPGRETVPPGAEAAGSGGAERSRSPEEIQMILGNALSEDRGGVDRRAHHLFGTRGDQTSPPPQQDRRVGSRDQAAAFPQPSAALTPSDRDVARVVAAAFAPRGMSGSGAGSSGNSAFGSTSFNGLWSGRRR